MSDSLEAIGVDLGGTKIEVGRVDSQGNILDSMRLETNALGGPKAIEVQIIESIMKLKGNSSSLKGIGIGIAGQVDAQTGVVYFAPNLPHWHNVPLKTNLEEKLKLPVKIINDVRAITLGEWLYGAGKESENLVCVFVGTGIGGGIVSQGRLLTGYSNIFGEVGHMTIDFQGPLCTCGKKGCWESIAGGWGIAKKAKDLFSENSGPILFQLANKNVINVTARLVVEAYRLNDPLAKSILDQVGEGLVVGCTNLINLYNPERLVLGGGIIDGMPEFIGLIEQGVRHDALKAGTVNLNVLSAKLGKGVGVIGAAAAILKNNY